MKRLTHPRRPSIIIDAFFDAVFRADDWLDRANKPLPFSSCAEWRAHCYANAAKKYEKQAEFPVVMIEWEKAFDTRLQESEAYFLSAKGTPPAPSRAEIIKRVARQTKAISALLSVMQLLQEAERQSALTMCAGMASAVARDLAALAGGAA